MFNSPGKNNLYARVPTIRMYGKSVKVKKHITYLGITLDPTLTWTQHIKHIAARTGLIFHTFAKYAKNKWGLNSEAMGTIYDHIFIPTITYACGTWGQAAQKVHPRRALTSAQRKALLLITKAYRTAPNASLQVMALKPPIEKVIDLYYKQWNVKWGQNININPSYTINANDLEKSTPFHLTHYPGDLNPIKFNGNFNNNCKVFTDGSKVDNHVGCSFVVYRDEDEIFHKQLRLADHCSVFQAELFAVNAAIHWCENNFSGLSINIVSDSQATIASIKNKHPHYLVTDIYCTIRHSTNEYFLNWTRAHQGNPGNERADELAKEAATDLTLTTSYNNMSNSTLKHILWNNLLENWQNDWNNNRQSITNNFFPHISDIYNYKWLKLNHSTSQFFTNHGNFHCYLNRFTNYSNNTCSLCGTQDGALHYIFNCPMLDAERQHLKIIINSRGKDWPCSCNELINEHSTYVYFNQLVNKYCKLAALNVSTSTS
ncbi:uncharacterized protein LOC111636626 [Centruroides sculpturatus]|uniref:uncharacterized protein LOC111636626 n=1 Tax=Centruroides sculpturatus TaxID=218467 RepID=UPI000C6D2537|nr:uncharacterized protein LOC111636626 [Centruroides sculpturatus]